MTQQDFHTPGISLRNWTSASPSAPIFHHGDALGTSATQTDHNQTTVLARDYDAFGLLRSSTGTGGNTRFGFAGGHGYQEDSESGLKLLGHPYYDASTGRFLTRDPIKDGRNWYTYCENNPLKSVDPDGLSDAGPTGGNVFNDLRKGSPYVVTAGQGPDKPGDPWAFVGISPGANSDLNYAGTT